MAVLEVDGLALDIADRPILKGISFAVEAGQVFGLVGESGSGKTLLSLSILGLPPPGARLRGAVRLGDADVTALPEDELCRIRGRDVGMVFQEPLNALNPLITIGEQVAEVVRIHRGASRAEAARIADRILERVELPAERFPRGRYPHELSGGQRQRVAIAIAIVLQPRLLIADEPTTALDATTQNRILDLLSRLAREDGTAVILIGHDLSVVARIADRVAVVRDGSVVEQGETVGLFGAPRHDYTRALVAAANGRSLRGPAFFGDGVAELEAENIVRDYVVPRPGLFRRSVSRRAVDGVSLRLRSGESLGIVGESGSGKSTLVRTLLALERPQGGVVWLGGAPFLAGGRGEWNGPRRRVQAVFQDPAGSLDPRWRVADIVAEPLGLLDPSPDRRNRDRLVAEALAAVGLDDSARSRFPDEFSGGQRQRIAIARALVVRPAVVVLDEATSALDLLVKAQILELLAGLSRRDGLAYLFVSHDLAAVRAITDRVMVMQNGRVVEEGETGAVFGSPRHPHTAALLAASPSLSEVLSRRRAAGGGQA